MGGILAIEGAKGVGKTALVTELRERLAGTGNRRVLLTKEPTPRFNLTQEARLLGADLARAIADDRAEHLREVITPALAAGQTVVCDRYILSSLVFHCADGVPADDVWGLNESFPLPGMNLVLTASPALISDRRDRRATLTRLEAASDPAAECDSYWHFGRAMEERGVPVTFLPNETAGDRDRAIAWIMRYVQGGSPS
jgi:dTMP kinase